MNVKMMFRNCTSLLRYRGQGNAAGDSAATLFLLLDLATFFDLFHGGKLKEALDTLAKLKLVPLSSSEVDQRVSAFRLLGEDVRRNLPDILVAAMTGLHSQYQGMKAKGQVRKPSLDWSQFCFQLCVCISSLDLLSCILFILSCPD